MDDVSMTGLLGLALDQALEQLRALGIAGVQIQQVCPPGKDGGRGTLRVVRALSGGRRLTVAWFPDEVRVDCE